MHFFRAHGVVVVDGARVFGFADRVRFAAALRRLKDIAAPRRLNKGVRGRQSAIRCGSAALQKSPAHLRASTQSSSTSNIYEISTEDIVDAISLLTYMSTWRVFELGQSR
jgi:hypothetical protein